MHKTHTRLLQSLNKAIFREERMFFMGNMPNILVWDQDATEKYLAISFRLPVSGHRASVLDTELGRRLYMHPELPFQVTSVPTLIKEIQLVG